MEKNSTTSVRRLYEDAKHLEQQIRNAPNGPGSYQLVRKTRLKLRDLYFSIINVDYEYSISKEVEMSLWKSCFYKPADDFRNYCKKAYRTVSHGDAKQSARAKEELVKICNSFKLFLDESKTFYLGLIKKFEQNFHLNLQNPKINENTSFLVRQAYISCHRCYIYLGDLMRYHRDLHQDSTQKNWTQATNYYQQAIRLYPESGHPHNQLAVMCTYKDFEFRTLYHYYRALFAKIPFPGTRENLTSLLERNKTKYQNVESESFQEEKNILENFLLCFVRLHGISFSCSGEELFPVVLPKALHLFEKLIQHGAIKTNLIWQLFIVNISTLHNAIEMREKEESEVTATSVKLSLTLLISFFANLLYQYLVLPSEKIGFYRNFYKPISLISSWLSLKSHFLSQPSDPAQRILWSKLRELFSKVVTKILSEGSGFSIENSDSLAPKSEDVDFQGFLPLQQLAEDQKIDFSLPQLSGIANDQRRREKIIQFAFFLCQTTWVDDEKFIYFDRNNNSFTVQNPALKSYQINEMNNISHNNINDSLSQYDLDDDNDESNNDSLFLVEKMTFNGQGTEDDEDDDELDDVVLFRPTAFIDKQGQIEESNNTTNSNFFSCAGWDSNERDRNNWVNSPNDSDSFHAATSPLRLVGLASNERDIDSMNRNNWVNSPNLMSSQKQNSPSLQSPKQQDILGVASPLNMGLYTSSNSFFPGISEDNIFSPKISSLHNSNGISPLHNSNGKPNLHNSNGISLHNSGHVNHHDFGGIWNSPTIPMNSSSFFSQFSNPLTGLSPSQIDDLVVQTNSIDLTDEPPPGLLMQRDDISTSPLIGSSNLFSRSSTGLRSFNYDESLSSLTG